MYMIEQCLLCTIYRFIHGGAWRDPLQDSQELQPALSQLLTGNPSTTTLDHIAGFASINYGLSTDNGDDESLNVIHPQHVQDVLAALKWLGAEYNVGIHDGALSKEKARNWIAVGHSCGATIAFQLCMAYSHPWGSPEAGSWDGKPPVAVVGLEGIYDLPLLNQTHIDQPIYADFITSAFGPDQLVWREASPVHGHYKTALQEGGMKLLVLGHSAEDELVERQQVDVMQRCLEGQGWSTLNFPKEGNTSAKEETLNRQLTLLELTGTHDEVWSEGTGVRTAIEVAVRYLFPIAQ
jgi:kynurenine formamidase